MTDRIGEARLAAGDISLNTGRPRVHLTVVNTSRRIVRVTSHFPFWQTNHRLCFDRDAARGYHLDIPAGSNVRWEPGERREVALVRFGGTGGG